MPGLLQDKARERVTPLDYMNAVMKADVLSGAPVMDHTAAIQTAINTGFNIDFIGLHYNANNLSQSNNLQTLSSSGGIARITKNDNGPILASTGNNVQLININFYGDAAAPTLTGHNVTFSGNQCGMVNCGSRWAYGRAVKATGSGFHITDHSDIYQTTDATATGYDIEIGVSGTATLYHDLSNVYTSQKTGGLLFIDCGSQTVRGGQYGKLTIQKGTGPLGTNGGKIIGGRILGDVSVGLSSAVFTGNQFDAINLTFLAGTSGCKVDLSNVFANGHTVTNSGNANNTILRDVSTSGQSLIKNGDDSSTSVMAVSQVAGEYYFPGYVTTVNNRGFRGTNTDASFVSFCFADTSNNLSYGIGHKGTTTTLNGGSSSLYLSVNTVSIAQVTASSFRPAADNTISLGSSGQRWNVVYAGTATINTSDETQKEQIEPIPQAWLDAWAEVEWYRFKFKEAVAAKGEKARWHVGTMAQRVHDAFAKHGIDAFEIGLMCYDEWEARDAVYTPVEDADGNVTQIETAPAMPAGKQWGLRYDECFVLEMALMRSRHEASLLRKRGQVHFEKGSGSLNWPGN